ncbi:response regulator transcription factor [bacterium]|nr:response regulator transcription factor [bacterium]
MKHTVLVASGDTNECDKLCTLLEDNLDCECWQSYKYRFAVNSLRDQDFDMVVLNSDLAGRPGLDLLRNQVGSTEAWRYLLLCPPRDIKVRERALMLGVYDCLIRPFSPLEFVQKAKRLLAMCSSVDQDEVTLARGLVYKRYMRSLYINGERTRLSAGEARLLEVLITNRNQVVTRKQICQVLDLSIRQGNSLNARVRRLRQKMQRYGGNLVTYRKIGYRLNVRKTIAQIRNN